MAKAAGWVRVERCPKHIADVCAECASLISEQWSAVLDGEFDRMRSRANNWLKSLDEDNPAPPNEGTSREGGNG